ncbi:MAG TPA: tRNA (adenosine(37)-N6)-threonylcarbamoyltransferase complex dimerization subunit type 1 TsaB [Tepidisphaeraceae bacterium]|jgi:tRNA threonylcarbamoyladenosine biosynthesis protein TsaB
MFSLAIETSGRIGSVALCQGERVIDERTFAHGLQHAAEMVPLIDAITVAQKIKPGQINCVYVSAGPGSFTGLRIGITFAKTFALATGAKIVAVPTVQVLAENAPPEAQHLIIVLDAKRGQIFTATFHRDGNHWKQDEPAHLDTLAAMLSRTPRPVHLLGEGIPYHRQFIPNDSGIIVTDDSHWRARAAAVAKVGHAMASQDEFTNPDHLIPIYVRKPEAEEKWDNQRTLNDER